YHPLRSAPSPLLAGPSHLSGNGEADSPCSPPPRAACLRCERGEGLGVGALSSLSLFAVPHPQPPPPQGEGNTPSLRLSSRHMRWPCPCGEGEHANVPLVSALALVIGGAHLLGRADRAEDDSLDLARVRAVPLGIVNPEAGGIVNYDAGCLLVELGALRLI